MNKLSVCIPTYNRAAEIGIVLEREVDFLYKNGIDIHVFDSSEGAETQEVIKRYDVYSNLYYHAVDRDLSSNGKVFNIYQEYCEKYEYIWIIHDHTIFTENALQYILECLDDNISYYFLKIQSNTFGWEDVTDRNQLLYDTAWLSGRFGTVILKSYPFLQNVDWEYFVCKYLSDKMWNYSHIGFYFERASQIDGFMARIIEFPRNLFCDISSGQKVGWYQDSMRICLECWGEVITNLPDTYTNKHAVLQTQDKWFISKYSLIEYKNNKAFNLGKYCKYRKWIKIIAPTERRNAFFISLFPVGLSKKIYTKKLLREIKRNQAMGRKICIYGAGRHAIECLNYIEMCGINVDAFLVTCKDGNPDKIRDYPVWKAERYIKSESSFIIIAVMSEKMKEVEAYLDTLKEENIIQYIEFV